MVSKLKKRCSTTLIIKEMLVGSQCVPILRSLTTHTKCWRCEVGGVKQLYYRTTIWHYLVLLNMRIPIPQQFHSLCLPGSRAPPGVCLEVFQVCGNIEPRFSQDRWAGPCVAGAPISLALDHEPLLQFVIRIAWKMLGRNFLENSCWHASGHTPTCIFRAVLF